MLGSIPEHHKPSVAAPIPSASSNCRAGGTDIYFIRPVFMAGRALCRRLNCFDSGQLDLAQPTVGNGSMKRTFALGLFVLTAFLSANAQTVTLKLRPQEITLSNGSSFTLSLPEGFAITVAAQGLKRVRFMARSPDNRIFVTDMYNLSDNNKGAVYILEDFDTTNLRFKRVLPYLKGLRNPNSIAFYTDEKGVEWFYLALTDQLLRYKYQRGEKTPSSTPEVLATFPDYGLGYKYGGWHLTRTVVIGSNRKLYVAVGSSCNACEEKEDVRASVLEMDPDGRDQRHFVRGLRNAVGLRWRDRRLVVTNMGSDHLGDNKPADTMYELKEGAHYGWPYCYQVGSRIFRDEKLNPRGSKMNCRNVPSAYRAFDAHSSPLGFEFFDKSSNEALGGYYLVALHGSTKKRLNRGYRVMAFRADNNSFDQGEAFINGFQRAGKINGRPVDIFRFGPDAFLLSDDRAGVIYYVYKRSNGTDRLSSTDYADYSAQQSRN